MTKSRAEGQEGKVGRGAKAGAELVVLHDRRDEWRELRIALPEGLVSGELEFQSPGLAARGWIVALLGTKSVLRRVGTLGAIWALFDGDEGVQLWLPGELAIPEKVVVQVEFSEAG